MPVTSEAQWEQGERPRWGRVAGAWLFALTASLALGVWLLDLWDADLGVPFAYEGDALFTLGLTKGVAEHGWFLHNPSLGAPFGLDTHAFWYPQGFNFAALKVLAALSGGDPVVAVNLFYLLSFPLTTLATLFAFLRLGFSYLPSLVGALLYTALPYHVSRGEYHLFLASSYWLVPLALLVAIRLQQGADVLFAAVSGRRWPRLRLSRGLGAGAIVVCVLLGSTGAYYAFFSCLFILVGGLVGAVRRRHLAPLASAGILVVVTTGVLIANLAPSIAHRIEHGPSTVIASRQPGDAERYGLRIPQMILPVTGHRLDVLARLKARYNRSFPDRDEGDFDTLGFVATAGFLLLLGWIFFGGRGADRDLLLDSLGTLNAAALLVGTVGAFAGLFALLAPMIRGYNRLSVYIGFLSLSALLVMARRLERLIAGAPWRKLAWVGALALVLVLGLLDLTPPGVAPNHPKLGDVFRAHRQFVTSVERALPNRARIFQLPHVSYPEQGRLYHMHDYAHLRTYIHSRTLRWSYPTMRGGLGDAWQRDVAARPPVEMVRMLVLAGFDGIYLDRWGFPDLGLGLIRALSSELRQSPRRGPDRRQVFFDLRAQRERMLERTSSGNRENLGPLLWVWRGSCHQLERTRDWTWRWCGREARLEIHNLGAGSRQIRLAMSLISGCPSASRVQVSGLMTRSLAITNKGAPLEFSGELGPGRHVLQVVTDAPRVAAAGDPRVMHFMVGGFQIAVDGG